MDVKISWLEKILVNSSQDLSERFSLGTFC